MTALRAFAVASMLAIPASAQPSDFDPEATESCLAAAPTDLASCIGHSADVCMLESAGGETTLGMGVCLSAELAWWSMRLEAAEAEVAGAAEAMDAEMRAIGSAAPSQSEAFAGMQAAWADWRDAACDWERSQWGGGSGGGPATAACLMRHTGEQALALEGWLAERAGR
jgi:uncharacterized protein YecT (DUF1311 family)